MDGEHIGADARYARVSPDGQTAETWPPSDVTLRLRLSAGLASDRCLSIVDHHEHAAVPALVKMCEKPL